MQFFFFATNKVKSKIVSMSVYTTHVCVFVNIIYQWSQIGIHAYQEAA